MMKDKKSDPFEISKAFDDLEEYLIDHLKKTMTAGHVKDGSTEYLIHCLQALQRYQKKDKNKIKKVIKWAKKESIRLLIETYKESYSEAVKSLPSDIPANYDLFGNKKLTALINEMGGVFDAVETNTLKNSLKQAREAIYEASLGVGTGARDLYSSIDTATRKIRATGITSVKYSNGRNVGLSSYVEMVTRTANHRAKLTAEGQRRTETKNYLVQVSEHANTCELCAPWEGKILVDDVFSMGTVDGEHDLLSTAMRAGLLHPNCRHTLFTYYPGISREIKTHTDKDKAIKLYKAEQQQRYYERRIRSLKRDATLLTDETSQNKASHKLKEAQQKMREHLEKYPELRRNYKRESSEWI